ncbi:MAG TPA: hypothetical protein VFJ13_03150, partial [Paracoccaceae bacterium]|nr:hypothetical protein [Paracoccaceae bacterium]
MKFSALAFAGCLAALTAWLPAGASERDPFLDGRSGYDEMLRFRAENGGSFRPRAVVIVGAEGALAARLPGAATVRNENRVDLSGTPGLGPLFRETLDVASVRQGSLVGPVYRVGDRLVID